MTANTPMGAALTGMFEGFEESRVEVAAGVDLHVRTAGSGSPVV